MDKKKIAELKGTAQTLQPTVHVGKDGVTADVTEELRKQLEKQKLVKVRLLQSLETDRKDAARELAQASSSVLIEVRGRTVVLARE